MVCDALIERHEHAALFGEYGLYPDFVDNVV